MQPYFFPYAGYFRLLAQADEFVIFDCVQFPRRGRVHRSEIALRDGVSEWLGLPLARQSRQTLIRDLEFAADARIRFDRQLARLEWLRTARGPGAERLRDYLHGPLSGVVDYLEDGLRLAAGLLGVESTITRSSTLSLDAGLRGEDRVIAVALARGATDYLNAPGGRELYDERSFRRSGLNLHFLPPYAGSYFHLLPALASVDPRLIRRDLGLDDDGDASSPDTPA